MAEEHAHEVTALWREAMQFGATAGSGFSLPMDAAAEAGGKGGGFRPMELILTALAGCTGMDVISILRKKRQPVTSYEVRVRGERTPGHPRVFTKIAIEHVIHGRGVDPAAVERAIALSEQKYCPVHAMVRPTVAITTSYRIEE